MKIWNGTSGWQYRDWRFTFYPPKVPQRLWLQYYCERFQTVEANNPFYRLPPPETFASWAEQTPNDFVFVSKMSRYLTHIKRLSDPREPVERFLRHAEPLGAKLGPVLLQLPPTLAAEPTRLVENLKCFPSTVRVAVEFRHPSWYTEEVKGILTDHGAALCLADRKETSLSPHWRTADWTYLRFHEGSGKPGPCYRRRRLQEWTSVLKETMKPGDEAFVFFNNDPRGCALSDAVAFAETAQGAGFDVTRVPSRDDITLAEWQRLQSDNAPS